MESPAHSLADHRDRLRVELRALLQQDTARGTQSARKKVSALGSEGIEVLISIIREETEKRKRRVDRLRGPRLGVISLHAALLGVAWLVSSATFWAKSAFLFIIASACICDVLFQLFDLPRSLEKSATALLADVGDKASVAMLIEALRDSIGYMHAGLMKGLERTLPTLNARDSALLSVEHIKILNECLRPAGAYDTVGAVAKCKCQVAILKGYEQIGDVHTLEAVRAVARERPRTSIRGQVVTAALTCLPYLEERVRDDSNTRLLRPSASKESDEGALLRPATAVESPDPETLLRPTTSSQSNQTD